MPPPSKYAGQAKLFANTQHKARFYQRRYYARNAGGRISEIDYDEDGNQVCVHRTMARDHEHARQLLDEHTYDLHGTEPKCATPASSRRCPGWHNGESHTQEAWEGKPLSQRPYPGRCLWYAALKDDWRVLEAQRLGRPADRRYTVDTGIGVVWGGAQ